jgi:hypothetical protein
MQSALWNSRSEMKDETREFCGAAQFGLFFSNFHWKKQIYPMR